MDAVVEASWRIYPAWAVIGLGSWLAFRGGRLGRAAWRRPLSSSMQPLAWMRAFRLTMIGLAVAATGAAWLWQAGWLLLLALAIGGEETLESSLCIAALKRAPASARAVRPRVVGGRVGGDAA